MIEARQFFIDGAWVNPVTPSDFHVINPATEQACAVISLGSAADVERAVMAARNVFDGYSQTSLDDRIALLEAIIGKLSGRLPEIADVISQEMGAPMWLATAAQAPAGLGHFMATLEALKAFAFEKPLGRTRLVHEAVGVCAMITPWNWPLNQIACKVAPALAAGCTMVLKPSEMAPLDAMIFAEILADAGVPKGVFNLINGDGVGVGGPLSAHKEVDFISFTGSTRAGIAVAQAAANGVKRVAQEMGGKSPNIILEDADLAKAVGQGMMTCFSNSGQSCNAPTRMFVPASKIDEVRAIVTTTMERVKVGFGVDAPKGALGPVANGRQYEKIQGLMAQGIEEGAKVLAGGLGRVDGFDVGYFVKPSVFLVKDNEAILAREEIFGPVLTIIPYDSEEHAISMANDTDYGLSAYVQSSNIDHARAVARKLRAGMVHINGAPTDIAAPFGGYKQSGNGREWGHHGLMEYMEVKAIMGFEAA